MTRRNHGPLRLEAPPDVDRYISGMLVVQDATNGGTNANCGVELTRHPDGAVELQLFHYEEFAGTFADRRDVPIGEQTFEALADVLFEPRSEGPAVTGLVTLETIGVTRIDDGRAPAHAVREAVAEGGGVTLTVEGIATDTVRTIAIHEPAVAAYLAGKAAMMRETAYQPDTVDQTGGEPRVDRPPLSVEGRMSVRVRSGNRVAHATVALSVEIDDGGTVVRVDGDHGEPSATVSSAAWEVERHWRRLLGAATGTSPDGDG